MKYIIINKQIINSIHSSMESAIINKASNATEGEIEEITDTELDSLQRKWRNNELVGTDYIIPLTDHPDHAATLAYRQTLRDWPSTSDFPDTKPTL